MFGDHKVKNVEELYLTAKELYDKVVVSGESSAEFILSNINQAVTNLQNNWHGADAGVKIQEVIKVYNEMIIVRNALAHLACDASVVAANYREIQIANGVNFSNFNRLSVTDKTKLDDYSDTQDTIDINPEAEGGRVMLENAANTIDSFISVTNGLYDQIMSNWLVGTGRDSANDAFIDFINNAKRYKDTLNNTCESIKQALVNYSF